jgi:hypothetical protein
MSNKHLSLALKCRHDLKPSTRLLLVYLADAASNGQPRKDGRKNLPEGMLSRGIDKMMIGLNTKRQQTVSDSLKELVAIGAITRTQRSRTSCMTKVSLGWLTEWAHTEETAAELTAAYTAKFKEEFQQQKACNQDNEKRVTKTTESVATVTRNPLSPTTETAPLAFDLPALSPQGLPVIDAAGGDPQASPVPPSAVTCKPDEKQSQNRRALGAVAKQDQKRPRYNFFPEEDDKVDLRTMGVEEL